MVKGLEEIMVKDSQEIFVLLERCAHTWERRTALAEQLRRESSKGSGGDVRAMQCVCEGGR